MGRKKQERFAENKTRSNILESDKEIYHQLKGNWNKSYFENQNPIILELACGYGEYSIGLGKVYQDHNFVGIDIKGDRLWRGSTEAIKNNLDHVAFLRTAMLELENFFEEDEVSQIWLIHPDPRPRKRDIRRRLTNNRFMDMYQRILKKGGVFHLKTDNDVLYDYTLEVLASYPIKNLHLTRDLHQSPYLKEHHDISTRYERRAKSQGLKINYLRFEFE